MALGPGAAAAESALHFVALGDQPYGQASRSGGAYRHLIELINAERPAFAIHVGDFKDGLTLCTDELYREQDEYFASYSPAVIYTPGDNDWSDCRRQQADPLERLQALRQRFFGAPRSLGASPFAVQRQADLMPQHAAYVENLRWWRQGVLFVTLHTVGPDDNADDDVPALRHEHLRRQAANIAWLQAAFDEARRGGAHALVLATQADMLRRPRAPGLAWRVARPFRPLLDETLLPLAAATSLPVLLIHGDSHRYIADQPFADAQGRPLAQLWRLQVPGESRMHAVRVTVNVPMPGASPASTAPPFAFHQVWNPLSPDPR